MDIAEKHPEHTQIWNQIKDFFSDRETITLKKGETFVDYDEKNRKLGILINGLLYATYIAENGKEWISRFYYTPENIIVSSHDTFMKGEKSYECIRAYEDSELIVISRREYLFLLKTNQELERLARILAEESYIQALHRAHTLQSLTAPQRVKKFVEEHSSIVSRVQRQHVASYLGIHRNIFTRILNKL